ncbi:histidine kinase [Flagellimonas flava]|uniref:GAF domain-containing protein n=1 Tax=Flagellimonas flava TaxID=570519 RepID=A0A1M5Q215_9FLAO|nr:histidine kinase [Allomuricauda flava]SHH08088.1 GAF domain-containing protein [Allomuricauda flava]
MKTEQFDDILIYFSKSLLGKEDEDQILWDLAKNCIAKLGFVDCVIYLIDENHKFLVQKAAYGPKNPKDHKLYNPVEIAVGEGITGAVALSGKAEIIGDTSKDKRYIVDDDHRLSEICVPIAHEKIIYGVIDCEHPEKGFFTQQHLKMLSAIASICAIKIKSVRANNALREKQESLLKIKEEMLELRLKVLNSQLNPHFVFNALNAIQYYVTLGNKKATLEYLSAISKLLRFHLKHLDREMLDLKDEITMLELYLKLQKLRYEEHFDYDIILVEDEVKLEAVIPSFVIQPLLENLIEAIMSDPREKQKLDIHFIIAQAEIIVNVTYKEDPGSRLMETTPRYSAKVAQWQDQVRLLNSVKRYGIKKEEDYVTKNGNSYLRTSLRLPNLSS